MNGHNIVAVYASRADGERAMDRLIEYGIPAADIRISMADAAAATGSPGAAGSLASERHEGFWDWLFGRDVPEDDREWYQSNLREGRTVLSVLVRDEAERQPIEAILDEFAPIEFGDGSAASMQPAAGAAANSATPPYPASAGAIGAGDFDQRRGVDRGDEEQVIPVVKEELTVGKRSSERRYRIRTYLVETPVENEVTLRDERVVVERRPVSREGSGADPQMPQQREYEVIERHEEPVVGKRSRNVEEVVVRKEVNERTETVRDTVRQTKVDVETEPEERTEALEGGPRPARPDQNR